MFPTVTAQAQRSSREKNGRCGPIPLARTIRAASWIVVVVVLCSVTFESALAAEKLTKVEIGRQGKGATAYIEVPGRGSGTGFCVHPSGLFVTNEHVIRGAENADVMIVLEPSLAGQRVFKGRVVRADRDNDLALVRVTGVDNLPSLTLGSVEGIAELAEVIACGFPLGRGLSTEAKAYPAISVNSGTITALRHKGSELQFLQIDVAINFGNSGGPVLDAEGHVVGVVVAKVRGATGINLAIPVSQLERFLKSPDLAIFHPEFTRPTLDKPQTFKVRTARFVPSAPEPDQMTLIVQAGDEEPREFPMEKNDGVWIATAAAVGRTAESRVEVLARIGSGSISGVMTDAVIKVADKVIRLSGVRRIDRKPKPKSPTEPTPSPTVLLVDGTTTLQGEIIGLEKMDVDVGGQKITLDLAKVESLSIQPVAGITVVTLTVVAKVDGVELARMTEVASIKDTVRIAPADPSSVLITPPELTEARVVKRLPEAFSDVVLGGGGRYLIFQIPKLRKLAIFDFNEARITRYIPLTEDNIAFAAGMDSLIVGLRDSGKLERWSLTTFEMERSAPPPFKEGIDNILLGHGSNGPLVVNGQCLDLMTYCPLQIRDQKGEKPFANTPRIPSANGTVYTAWKTNQSPDESMTFVLEGNVVKRYVEGGLKHVVPGPDGRTIYTAKGICSTTLARSDREDANYGYCLPAVHGDYFLSLNSASGGKPGMTIYLRGLTQHIAKLDKLDHGLSFDGWDRESFGPWKRVYLVPDAHVIAILPGTNDQVVLYQFDAEEALERSGQDYLFVTSQPPRVIEGNSEFRYAIKVKSRHPALTFTLDSGPKGMNVSPEGVLTWPPDASVQGNQDVIVTIKNDGGQETFHTFAVRVVR